MAKIQEASLSNILKNRLAFRTFYIAYTNLVCRQDKIHVTVYDRKPNRSQRYGSTERFRLKVGCCLDRLSTVPSGFNDML
jgi:hypothetical protein